MKETLLTDFKKIMEADPILKELKIIDEAQRRREKTAQKRKH